jgi:hypothetical protein
LQYVTHSETSNCSGGRSNGGIDVNGKRSSEQAESPPSPDGQAASAHIQDAPSIGATAGKKHLNHFSRGDVADETTRYLAAATQVDLGYARTVRRRIVSDPFHALAPVYGADPVVIACWALSALRRRFRRDAVLAMMFIGGAGIFFILSAEQAQDAWIWAFAIILLIAVVGVATREKFQIRRILMTRMRREVFNPADAPQPGNAKVSRRLAAVADRHDGNLVIFQGNSPFAGSGRQLHPWHLVLDVSRGTELGDGTRRKPDEFTSTDLHAELIDAFGQMGLPDAHAEERLFVNGRHIQHNPDLLPGWKPPGPPPARVADSVLRQAARHPTPDARVYVCLEMPGWQGQLVTTLFARAVHTGGSLYLEWSFHVLPPLSKLFSDIDEFYDEPAVEQLGKAVWRGLLCAIPAFLKSPLALAWYGWQWGKKKARRGLKSWKIGRGQVFDYGAARSIREDASGFSSQDPFIEHDQNMAIWLAQETLLQAVASFLVEHHIDIGEFEGQVQVINYSTQKSFNLQSFNVGNVSGTGIVIGNKSAATNTGNEQAPPSPEAEAKGALPPPSPEAEAKGAA